MSDHYTQFSESLDVGSEEHKRWLDQWLTKYHFPDYQGKLSLEQWCEERHIDVDDAEYYPNFQYSWEDADRVVPGNRKLWIYTEESGSVEDVANMVLAFFKHFKIDDEFSLTWAETCSKMAISEFSGGGFMILNRKITWITPFTEFDQVRKREERRKRKAKKQ